MLNEYVSWLIGLVADLARGGKEKVIAALSQLQNRSRFPHVKGEDRAGFPVQVRLDPEFYTSALIAGESPKCSLADGHSRIAKM